MKRRNFIGGLAALMCGAIAGCKCLATPKVEESVKPWGKEPVPMRFVNGKWTADPFVKIYTETNKITYYKKYRFTQTYSKVYCIHEGWSHWEIIPIDFKVNQKSKDDFITELNKYNLEWNIFEIIADNGKSNIYAQAVDSKNNEKSWDV